MIVLIKTIFAEDFVEEAKEGRKFCFKKRDREVAATGAAAATIITCWHS